MISTAGGGGGEPLCLFSSNKPQFTAVLYSERKNNDDNKQREQG